MAKTTNTAPGEQADIDPDMTAAPGQVPDRVIEELRLACRTATDYGRDPVEGTLVGLSADEVVIRRTDERAGTLHVHFPREGFQIKEQTA